MQPSITRRTGAGSDVTGTAEPRGRLTRAEPERTAGRGRATIADVARLAGVSLQTVSNVLNNHVKGRMTKETEERVFGAMVKLDYCPDARAVRLRGNRAQAIAVTVLDPSPRFLADAFTAEVLSGIAYQAGELGYRVLLSGGAFNHDRSEVVKVLRSREADGMIVLPSGASAEWLDLLDAISSARRPFVVVQSQIELPTAGIPTGGSVSADDHGGGAKLGRLLTSLGHREIVFLTTEASWPAVERRFDGICETLGEAGVAPPEVVKAADWTVRAAAEAIAPYFERGRASCSAVVGANDVLAAGALVAARRQRLKVPRGVSIVGFDDLDVALAVIPALTTVRVPGFSIGVTAADDLIRRAEEPEEYPAQSRIFATELVLRDSHAPPQTAGT